MIMKRNTLFILVASWLLIAALPAHAQTYIYTLSEDFLANVTEAPPLVQIPNNSGLTGDFTTRTVPASTCEQGGTAGGYFFEDDAGLQFTCPEGFISEAYSLSMIFQVDELITPPAWVRILSFTHTDDHGIYIYLTNPPMNGTLDFWPYGTVGEANFFDTENFFQLILVRNVSGLIKVYVNGSEFAEYDDSGTQEYKFHAPDNYLIFFRDHPSVLADEASPGFVSNIKISNMAWTESEVAQEWDDFCGSLFSVSEPQNADFRLYPNPAATKLNIESGSRLSGAGVVVCDLTGKVHIQEVFSGYHHTIDISGLPQGLYFLRISEFGKNRVIKFAKR